MSSVEIWNLLLGALVGSLVTVAIGGVYGASKLASIQTELAGLRRDVERLLPLLGMEG